MRLESNPTEGDHEGGWGPDYPLQRRGWANWHNDRSPQVGHAAARPRIKQERLPVAHRTRYSTCSYFSPFTVHSQLEARFAVRLGGEHFRNSVFPTASAHQNGMFPQVANWPVSINQSCHLSRRIESSSCGSGVIRSNCCVTLHRCPSHRFRRSGNSSLSTRRSSAGFKLRFSPINTLLGHDSRVHIGWTNEDQRGLS